MTTSTCRTTIRVLAMGILLAATSRAEERPPIVAQMAKAYGLDSFGQIERIRYTFNLDLPGLKLSRTWEWDAKNGDEVSYEGKDKDGKPVKVTYRRSQLGSETDLVKDEIDPGFVNDNYWLIFPFHVAWDTGAKVEDTGMHALPLGKGSGERVLVKYPADEGYTPGDTWELYLGADHRIREFIYHRGGPKKPSLVTTTWAGYKKAGPLLVSMDHRGTADGKPVRVFFSDVSVKLTGSDTWVNAR
jgi:hypothetical protein